MCGLFFFFWHSLSKGYWLCCVIFWLNTSDLNSVKFWGQFHLTIVTPIHLARLLICFQRRHLGGGCGIGSWLAVVCRSWYKQSLMRCWPLSRSTWVLHLISISDIYIWYLVVECFFYYEMNFSFIFCYVCLFVSLDLSYTWFFFLNFFFLS